MTETASDHPRQGGRSEPDPQTIGDATAAGRHDPGLTRRHAAADRLPPLSCRCRDPWDCRRHSEPVDDRTLDSWQAAAAQLAELGLPPILPRAVRIALHRRELDRRLSAVACA